MRLAEMQKNGGFLDFFTAEGYADGQSNRPNMSNEVEGIWAEDKLVEEVGGKPGDRTRRTSRPANYGIGASQSAKRTADKCRRRLNGANRPEEWRAGVVSLLKVGWLVGDDFKAAAGQQGKIEEIDR
jgi:hypothetical protein